MSAAALDTPVTARAGRTLGGYLLLPRPKDAVKWWIAPITFALAALARPGLSVGALVDAVLIWAVLELLIYQARYQWNDIRGFAADQRHPDAQSRGRLPGPVECGSAHIAVSRVVLSLRLVAALLVGAAIGRLGVMIALTGAVFGVGVVYEAVRGRATGRTTQVPPPARPAILGLWVVVGGGYAIRGTTGVALATTLADRPALASAVVVGMWGYGVMFVTMRWALEALAFAGAEDGRVTWAARADQAREHTTALARWLASMLPEGGAVPSWPALSSSTDPRAPWNVALLVAAPAAAVAGRALVGSPSPTAIAIAIALGLAAGILVIRTPRRGLAALAGAAMLAVGLALGGAPRPLLAAAPWAVLALAYWRYSVQSLDSLGRPLWRPVRG
jgi:hypothetical protein